MKKNKKTLVFISDSFPPEHGGGAGVMASQLATHPWEEFEVSVITTTKKGKEITKEKTKWGTLYRIPAQLYSPRRRLWRTLYMNSSAREALKILKKIQPDLIHYHNLHQYFSYKLIKKVKKLFPEAKQFLTAHDVMTVAYGKLKQIDPEAGTDKPKKIPLKMTLQMAGFSLVPFRISLTKHYLKSLNKIIVVSSSLEACLKANGIKNTLVVRNGIKQQNSAQPSPQLKQIFTKDKDAKWLLFLGRTSSLKGTLQVIKAQSELLQEGRNINLFIAGETNPAIEDLIQKNPSLKEKIFISGWMDHEKALSLYQLADICLVPSLYIDPFPTTVIEAASQNCPLIITCFGGAKEAIKKDKEGLIVNPYKISELKKAITSTIDSPKKAQEKSQAAHSRWKREFSTQPFIQRHRQLYL